MGAVASIESTPRFAPPRGATGYLAERTEPQKEQLLAPQETLTLNWQTTGRFLKSEKQAGRILAANPTFTEPGLYSVHVTLDVITSTGTVRLRSNEQLVSIGGSRRLPKATYGQIQVVAKDRKSADLNLGALDQVVVGDQFDITSKTAHWRLTITDPKSNYSTGKLELLSSEGDSPPVRGDDATLVRQNSPRR